MRFRSSISVLSFKALAYVANGIGNHFIYNRNAPEVGKVIRDVAYGEDRKQSLDVLVPKGEGPFPVLVYIHGGGWSVGDKKIYDRVCKTFAAKGYLVFNINYRLGPKYHSPIQFQDMSKAIYYAYIHAKSYGGDPNQMILGGDSAGAHLSSWYAAALNKENLFKAMAIRKWIPREVIRGLLLYYGAYEVETTVQTDFRVLWVHVGHLIESLLGKHYSEDKETANLISPLRHITKDYPPVFIASAEKDKLHGESIALGRVLKRNNIEHETLFISKQEDPKAAHAFLNLYYLSSARMTLTESVAFLDKLTKKKQVL